jgi:putative tricarboxylic transport membrane protein
MNSSGNDQRPASRGTGKLNTVLFGIGTAVVAALFGAIVIPAGIVNPASVKHVALLPSFLPYVLTALIGALGLVIALQAMLGAGPPKRAPEEEFQLRSGWPAVLAVLVGCAAAYYLLPESAGLLMVSIAVTGVLMVLGGERRPIILLGAAVLLPTAVYLFFSRVAQVPLPAGILDGWM